MNEIESDPRARCLLPWVPLVLGAESTVIIDRWKALAGAESDSRLKGQYATIALLFAAKVKRDAVWKKALEDWNVEENSYVNSWIAVGEKRGEARGVLEADRSTVLRLGAKRLGPAPAAARDAVLGIADRERLERLVDRTGDAVSWDDLIATP